MLVLSYRSLPLRVNIVVSLFSPSITSRFFSPASSIIISIRSKHSSISKRIISEHKEHAYPSLLWNRDIAMNEAIRLPAVSFSDEDIDTGVLEGEAFPTRRSVVRDLEFTLNRLSKWFVAALFAAAILLKHDARTLWISMGSIANVGLSVLLKRILRKERPPSSGISDPGMPSSHAQSIYFAVVFAISSVMEWSGMNVLALFNSLLILAFGCYLTWLRVSLGFHSMDQVIVGAALGSVFYLVWLYPWYAFVLKALNSSHLVQTCFLLVTTGSYLGFLIYITKCWIKDDQIV